MSASPTSVIRAVGACLPDRVVTNDDLVAAGLNTSDDWIRTRTGIAARRRVAPGTSTGDLATRAAESALASAPGDTPRLVILATTTPDHPCPATAPQIASRLGLTDVPAFDLAAVCSGFVYALATADAWIRAGAVTSALVIGAETYSTIVDPADRDTAPIFGDGAGAVVLGRGDPDEPGAILATDLGSDGTGADQVMIATGGSRAPAAPGPHTLRMKGREVYGHAVRRMTTSAQRTLDRLRWPADSVGAFIGHQANQRILDAVADRLAIAPAHRFGNIRDVGNTAAASIPLVLADVASKGAVRPGTRTLLTAFGGGLTWGCAALTWPDLTKEPTMTTLDSPVYEHVAHVLTTKFDVLTVEPDATFDDLGMDSLAVVELFVTLSEHWGIVLDDAEADPELTVQALVGLVERARS
ncbi:beta-ketoacyl-ACP synthase 3 [Streptomyces roseirectus]|uniref:Beta-ketoacyl-[acyl-carrier-protein] synthase III n=1 Tax=Streptomyces roseirectus TaxID=2768066 RepID=A0A7H0IFE4_9ACTN|nr:beta-ketoacyl-ACP synthase 3 [Streptomyces roseirectus]QNP71510.1 beta-ketoacyl-ACP synthase 3 [Streptomyces roseirectus]